MKNGLSRILLVILVVLGLSAISALAYAAPDQSLQVSFINVGQVDSALMRNSNNFDIPVDGGKSSADPTVKPHSSLGHRSPTRETVVGQPSQIQQFSLTL